MTYFAVCFVWRISDDDAICISMKLPFGRLYGEEIKVWTY